MYYVNSQNHVCLISSVARLSPIDLATKMKNKENTTFLALLRVYFALEELKNDLKHLLKYLFRRGANSCKIKLTNQ